MKRILVINTGGTIAMSQNRETGKVSPTSQNPLSEHAEILKLDAYIDFIDYLNIPSPHMTVDLMHQLKHFVQDYMTLYDGIVITHGTDILEETAYFLDLTLNTKIPIVMTGAMRSSNEIGADGLSNLKSALITALNYKTAEQGVVIVMNEEVHAAAFVTKTHTTNLATFQTPTFGPVGIISNNQVTYFQKFYRQSPIENEKLTNKKVGLVKAYADMDPDILLHFLDYDGLVIEGLGAGNMPPSTVGAIKQLLQAQVQIVMVSRAFNGIPADVYDYEGGGKQLHQLGVIFAQGLSGLKARLKLLVVLNSLGHQDVKKYFEIV